MFKTSPYSVLVTFVVVYNFLCLPSLIYWLCCIDEKSRISSDTQKKKGGWSELTTISQENYLWHLLTVENDQLALILCNILQFTLGRLQLCYFWVPENNISVLWQFLGLLNAPQSSLSGKFFRGRFVSFGLTYYRIFLLQQWLF